MSENTSIEVNAADPSIEVEGFVVVGPSRTGDHNHDHATLTGLAEPDHPTSAVIGLDAALAGKEAAGTAAAGDAAHVAAADPHTGYQKESEKAAANGYASLDATTKVPFAQLPTGTGGTQVAVGNHAHTAVTPGHSIEDETTALTQRAVLRFTGAGVTAVDIGGRTVVDIPGGGGGALEVRDEGVAFTTAATALDFIGYGVTASDPVADVASVLVAGQAAAPSSGQYGLPLQVGYSATAAPLNSMYLVPFYVSRGFTTAFAVINVVTGGTTGSVVRIGVYDNAYTGAPYAGALLADFGTFSTINPGNVGGAATALALTARADPYWIAVVSQVAAATLACATGMSPPSGTSPGQPAIPFARPHKRAAAVTGALPAASGATFATGTNDPVPFVSIGA